MERENSMESVNFAALAKKANEAGVAAVAALQVVPMVVQERASPMDDGSPVVKEYFVADGVCGFAGIAFPGVGPFAKYAKQYLGARKGYPKGLYISVSAYNQSLQKKEAYAGAYAAVLREAGVKAYMESRMD